MAIISVLLLSLLCLVIPIVIGVTAYYLVTENQINTGD